MWPDDGWVACCVEHDIAYWCGGSADDRWRADNELLLCIRDCCSGNLARVTENLEKGNGALPILLHDEEFGRAFTGNLRSFAKSLDSIGKKLDDGTGTAGKLINDPSLFDAANRLAVGVNESALLRWLIKDRQKAGIQKEYDEYTRTPTPTPHASVAK